MQLQKVTVSAEHNCIVVPSDQRIPNVFPHQKTLPDGKGHVLPNGGDEVRVLRNLGYEVPSPITAGYDWGGITPFKAQVVTAAMLVVEPRAFVLSGMGTGKSLSVLFAYDYLKKAKIINKLLVVAPLSTLNFTWAKEVFDRFPKYSVGVLHGSKAKRLKVLAQDFDIYVINHDGLGTIEKELRMKFDHRDIIVFDEVSAFRNARSLKHKIARDLTPTFGRVWGLTGTPTPRDPTDAFGIIKLINPGSPGVPKAFTHFRDQLMTKQGMFRWTPKPGAQEQVYKYMQPAVRFTLADCIDMPPTIYQDYETKLGPDQKRVYSELVKHCRAMSDMGSITAANEAVVLNKLLQVSTGCVFMDDKEPKHLDNTDRMKVLSELIESNDRSVIVFAPYVPLVKRMAEELGKKYKVHAIHGGVSQAARTQIFSTFQGNPAKQVIVAHPATMSHGLTLTNANLIVWAGPVWDLEVYSQANARISRPGQTSDRVVVAHIVGTAVERRVYRKLQGKDKMQGVLLDMFE